MEDSNNVVPGGLVTLSLEGFLPNASVAVELQSGEGVWQLIGSGTTDAQGHGVVIGVIPPETPFGPVNVRAIVSHDCWAGVPLDVVGSLPAIGIDDHTLVAGQHVTLTASGFAAGDFVGLFLDGNPGDALCRCREIGLARADARGLVVMRARIPRDVAPGAHFLLLSGTSFDGEFDLALAVDVTVVGAQGTMPPTDTVSAD